MTLRAHHIGVSWIEKLKDDTMRIMMTLLTMMTALMGQSLDSLFGNTEGTLLISSLDDSTEFRVNSNLGDSAYIPASTFKIPHTLIALETGVIDSSTIFEWDSLSRSYEPWNQDQNLTNAFNRSCVWCYQTIAEELSDSIYLDFLRRFDYGNQITGDTVTTFWLNGDIRISVNQQVDFLKRMYRNELPVDSTYIDLLKNVMIIERNDKYTLRAKTGWSGEDGWFVGYFEVDNSVWFFANHIRITNNDQLALRKSLVMDAFRELGIID